MLRHGWRPLRVSLLAVTLLAAFASPAAANTAPTCADQQQYADLNSYASLFQACQDPDGDPLTMAIVTPPPVGAVEPLFNGFKWTPPAGFTGDVTATYTASDGTATSAPATIGIHVEDYRGYLACEDIDVEIQVGESKLITFPCSTGFPPSAGKGYVQPYDNDNLWDAVDGDPYSVMFTAPPYTRTIHLPFRLFLGESTSKLAAARISVVAPPGPDGEPGPPIPAPPGIRPDSDLTAPPPPAPPSVGLSTAPVRMLLSSGVRRRGVRLDRRGRGDVMTVVCATACSVSAEPAVELVARRGARSAARRTLRLARQRFSLAAGRSGLIRIRVPDARKRLAGARSARLHVGVSVRDANGAVSRDTVRLALRAR